MTVLEWVVRANLDHKQDRSLKVNIGGNPRRTTTRPTAEKLLAVFENITLVTIESDGFRALHLTPLNPTQLAILLLLDFSTQIYTQLCGDRALPP